MAITCPTAPNAVREPGGTTTSMRPIRTDCTSVVPKPLKLKESTGLLSGAIATH